MSPAAEWHPRLVHDETEVLADLVPLDRSTELLEAGCGGARLAQRLLQRHPHLQWLGLEVDAVQHGKNLARLAQQPASLQARMRFEAAGAQAIPCADGRFDGALMLKSLHHVPMADMDQAMAELHRVLRPGAWLYVSEPVYAGALNDIVRIYNDEGPVRAAAQAALDRAVASGRWSTLAEQRFDMPTHFADWGEFETRMLYPSFVDHGITPELSQEVQAAFSPHIDREGPGTGVRLTRPIHVRVLTRMG